MFNFFKKKQPVATPIAIKISGMHCTSCALTIDNELEDIDGVIASRTNYAKSQTLVMIDPTKVTPEVLKAKIVELGYTT